MPAPDRLPGQYVLPLRWTGHDGLDELTAYLHDIAGLLPVIVVDGSPDDVFARHATRWASFVEHVRPEPWPGRNGKVAGVMTGVRRARAERVVIADDDVRYTPQALRRVLDLLEDADLVRPQNYFTDLPWHARWDTARTLVNRSFGSDYPGTLAVRRSRLIEAGGYDGDVLFENLELIRTIRAAGGREVRADDLFVARLPPTARHFLGQRVRQAYDSLAQPARLGVELALLPTLVWITSRNPRGLAPLAAAAVLLAERGRCRRGGAAVFPRSTVLYAPLWTLERAACSWVALGLRVAGGVPYAGGRIARAASPRRARRTRQAVLAGATGA